MSQMTYKEFIKEIRSILLLTTGYDESSIYFKPKENYPSTPDDRLFVEFAKLGHDKEVCSLYITDLYAAYQAGATLQEIAGEITQEIKRIENTDVLTNAKQLSNYEAIKEKLFIRLVNLEKNQSELKNAIYRINGDIALVLYVLVGDTEDAILFFKVPKSILQQWEIDEDTVFDAALLNTYFLTPPRIYQWSKLKYSPNYTGENFMNLTARFQIDKGSQGNCLTTTQKTNGAIAIFLPGVAQRIKQLLGSNFYVVFTSIHEAMIHKADTVNLKEIKSALTKTINECTPEADFLSDNIYYCDGNTISKVD